MDSFKTHLKEVVGLSAKELDKDNSVTGEPRLAIMKKLIKGKKPIELKKGGSVVVTDIEDALKQLDIFAKQQSNLVFQTDKGPVKLTQLAKSKVFGGGVGGAGSGTADTERNESHNAAMMKAVVDHGKHDIDFFNEEIIAQAYKDNSPANISANTDKILQTPEDWVKSSYNISMLLYKEGYINKNQRFHRGSKDMIKLYALKNKAYKNQGFSPLKDDKWNPGDVWAIDKSFNMDKELDTSSVGAFNQGILEHFNTRRLVGISLKGPENKGVPPLKEYNNQYPPDTDNHKIKQILLSSGRGTYWSAKGIEIKYDAGSLVFKDNTPGGTIKAEVKGKKARGGGLSWGVMQEFMKRETGKKLPKHSGGITKLAKKIADGSPRERKLYWKMYSSFYKNDKYKTFESELDQKDWKWISAKLASTYVAYYLLLHWGNKSNQVITHFINYAGSKTLDSSTYVKLGK